MPNISNKEIVERIKNNQLLGSVSHKKMAPYRSVELKLKPKNVKESAVCILLYPKDGELHTVLIQRPDYKGTHARQVSFPGGKRENSDKNLQETALRETFEEVGVEVDSKHVIRELTPIFIPPSNFMVNVYVALIDNEPSFIPDSIEVDSIIKFKVKDLFNDDLIKDTSVTVQEIKSRMKVPYFNINNKVVWGATACMLSELRDLLLSE